MYGVLVSAAGGANEHENKCFTTKSLLGLVSRIEMLIGNAEAVNWAVRGEFWV
jgi:hypothetical protein